MTVELIRTGFEVFLHDGEKAFGAVREVKPHGRPELVVYIENAGDFIVPLSAVQDVHSEKVVLNPGKLDRQVLLAISHAHAAEDPSI